MPPVLVDRGHRFEAWTNPNATTFKRKFDLSKWVGYTIAHKYGAISDGKIDLPADFPKLPQLFAVDKTDHANDVASVIRVLNGTAPITHYVLKRLDARWSSAGDMLEGQLEGFDYFLDRALVPNFDAPAKPTVEPDWHYGMPTILLNSGLEESGLTSAAFQLEINATAGTFTILITGISASPTSAINWNTDSGSLAIAIEALDPGNVDVVVSGAGTPSNPFIVEFLLPAETDIGTVSTDSGGLTGLASVFILRVGGASLPDPWSRSFHPTVGIYHGTYFDFETSTAQAHTGTSSLYVNGDLGDWPASYPGAQQLVNVTGGRTYRASVWVYPEFTAPYRFIIRTFDETEIVKVEGTLTAGSWQQLVIPPFVMPSYVTRVIFRIACISNSHGVQEFYVDDALLAPGFDEDTYGKIMGDLLDAVQAAGYLTWVTRTWSDTLDSAGNAWDRDVQWSIRHRQSMLQLVEYADRWNYESTGIYWSVANDRFEWGLFNPNAGMSDFQGTGFAVIGKAISQTGTIAKAVPDATTFYAEGDAGHWGEAQDADLITAYGPLQKSYFNNQSLDSDGQTELATRMVADAAKRTEGLVTRISAGPIRPWVDFVPGDRNIMVNLAPKRAREYMRCVAIVATKRRDDAAPVYEAHWDAVVFQGEAAHLETTRRLVRAFQAQRPPQSVFDGRPADALAVGTGTFSIFSLPGQAFVEVGRLRIQWPFQVAILGVSLACNVAPTGASIIVDVNRNGIQGADPPTTIFTAPAVRPSIAAGAKGGLETIPSISLLGPYEQLTVDVDQVGSTLPGGDLTIMVRWNWVVPQI